MSTRDPSPWQAEAEARVWLRRLTSGEAREVDVQGFQRWLQRSHAHRDAFGDVRRRWKDLGPAAEMFLRTQPVEAGPPPRAGTPSRLPRRAFIGMAMGAAAAAGVAVVLPGGELLPSPDAWGADDRTAAGEQRVLALAGHVEVMLNTRTSVRRHAGAGVDLLLGELAVDLAGRGTPFEVVAGVGRSTAESGRFEVRYLDGKACVSCIEGALRVSHPAGDRLLGARQQLVYDRRAVSSIAAVDPRDVSAWRRGELVFDQVRLDHVLAEINRYRPGRVVLMKRGVGDGLVSGRFRIASLDSALAQLQQMFTLSARHLPGGLVLLA